MSLYDSKVRSTENFVWRKSKLMIVIVICSIFKWKLNAIWFKTVKVVEKTVLDRSVTIR